MNLVMIDWLDSHSGNGWQRLESIRTNGDTVKCRSVGWLVSESGGRKVLVPHLSDFDRQGAVPYGSGDISIPDKAIVKMRVLQKGRR